MAKQEARLDPNAKPALIAHSAVAANAETRQVVATNGSLHTTLSDGTNSVPSDPRGLPILAGDSPSIDAFGRWRSSTPTTLFDSKQIHDSQALFWDDQETSGTGTGSSYNANQASTTISVSASTAGTRVRQTFQRFNYQPGKSQLILMTANLIGVSSGISRKVGYFDDNNGLYFESNGLNIYVVRRTKTSGSVANNPVIQSSWNVDKMDGTGISGITINPTKTQIMYIDFEWLGVGRVRMGFVIDGKFYLAHEFLNTNVLDVVYMSTPNLPVRYEISNNGTGAAASLVHICSSVMSEGGQDKTGILRHIDSGSITGLATGTTYALIGMRLQSAKLDGIVEIENLSIISTTQNDQAHWELIFNPTVAGTFTYSDQTNSVVQTATGASTNTITNGTEIDGGYFSTSVPSTNTTPNALKLGSNIAGTADQIVLTCTPITNNISVQASITWRELS